MVVMQALMRTTMKQVTRSNRFPQMQKFRGFALRTRRDDDDDDSFRGRRHRKLDDFEDKDMNEEDSGDLYDPYRTYMETTGERGYREFNPDNVEDFQHEWEEPAAMMEDKSWPATSGTDLFTDLLNIPNEPPSGEKLDKILKEAFARMGHTGHIDDIKLPEMDVEIPANHPDREALEIMKLSMMNNGRLKMEDKNYLMKAMIDELDHVRNDKTTLFKGLDVTEKE
ncbi:uncharacterized protein PHALS_08704 [Plasmopara halstedii]|uniref:Uncharacterized protein n=1 Tax=Plasmopara halstedii TaxID=4781 RepID=A0A0N7L4G9_PLAHL|nr:uncharacterized protein PHALS_08704 [Plasmopara halstedii]CEG38643.1 hypothetical protein PHALS_08704 [Plasmopara halstedii]|eukprot:XP_024575012.1 hypothetical protein PHALS_08704 [Plasmopara halstedii]